DARGRPRPDLKQPREIVVRADPATNSLIVDAPVQRLAGFEQLVAQLDQQQVPDDLEVRTYRIKRAQLDAAASTLRQLVASKALPGTTESGAQGAISITTEPVSRSLVVSGPRQIFEGVESVLAEVDARAAGPATGLAMYPLEHARADSLQPLLQRLLIAQIEKEAIEQGLEHREAAGLLDIAADRTTNTL